MNTRKLSSIFIIMFALLIWIGFILKANAYPAAEHPSIFLELYKEIFKTFCQFCMIGVIGHLLVNAYHRNQEKRQEKKDFRKALSRKLIASYLTAKRARWDLRANYRSGKLKYRTYQKAIMQLVKLKSEIEVLEYEVEAFPSAFINGEAWTIKAQLKIIEEYIDSLVDEGQKKAEESEEVMDVESFPLLRNFLRARKKDIEEPKEKTPFGQGCRQPIKTAIQLLILPERPRPIIKFLNFSRNFSEREDRNHIAPVITGPSNLN